MSKSKEAATPELGTKLTSRNARYSSGYEAEADMPKISADFRGRGGPHHPPSTKWGELQIDLQR